MRTPISFARCSTTYDSTLNRPDTVNTSASPPRTTVDPEGDLQQVGLHPGHRSQGHDAPNAGSTLVRRSSSAWRACSGSPRTRRISDVPGSRDRSGGTRPRTSRTFRTGAPRIAHDADDRQRARRAARIAATPIAEPRGAPPARRRRRFGQSWRAMVSDTTTTPASAVRSACVKPRPLTRSRPSTAKYSDDTAICSTGSLPVAHGRFA